MLKAFTPVITMGCTFVAGLERPTISLISSVLIIATGVIVASYGEINFNWMGIGIMFASEVFEALKIVMTQILLTKGNVKFNASA